MTNSQRRPAWRGIASLAAAGLIALPALAGASGIADGAPPVGRNPLATNENLRAERMAEEIVASPQMQGLVPTVAAKWRTAVTGKLGSIGQESLDALIPSVQELAYSAAQRVVNNDPQRPAVTTILGPPHRWFGNNVPGGRFGVDNPDTVYRQIPIDSSSSYVIDGRVNPQRPVTQNFFLVTSPITQQNVAFLDSADMKVDGDGTFRITVDPDPANGRPNHIQTTPQAGALIIRDTVSDWQRQTATSLSVRRIAGPKPAPAPTRAQLIANAVDALQVNADGLVNQFLLPRLLAPSPNTLAQPFPPGTVPGFSPTQSQSVGNFKLTDGNAILVTVNPGGAAYFNVPVTNVWMVTPQWWTQQTSLNNTQSKPNADGTYTFVLSLKDPGIWNWVSTGGLSEGTLFLRWQGMPPGAHPAVTASVINLSEVPRTLAKATPADRAAQIAQRTAGYQRRYQTLTGTGS